MYIYTHGIVQPGFDIIMTTQQSLRNDSECDIEKRNSEQALSADAISLYQASTALEE
jgi:hypothetical protein